MARPRWIRPLVAMATVLALASLPAPATTAQTVDARPSRVLVEQALGAPDSVDVAVDGTVHVAEASTGRVGSQRPDGSIAWLTLLDLPARAAIAVAADGTRYVGGLDTVVKVTPEGTQVELPTTGLTDVSAVAVDGSGTVYVVDAGASDVVTLESGGAQGTVGFTGLGAIAGVAVDEAGTVYVIDLAAEDVVARDIGGTQSPVGFTTLTAPVAVDVRGAEVAVAQTSSVTIRNGSTEVTLPGLPIVNAQDLHLAPGGVVYVADKPAPPSRTPSGPGKIIRAAPPLDLQELRMGDVGAIGSLSSPIPGTVYFGSSSGQPGYSDPNPTRRVNPDGSIADVLAPDAGGLGTVTPDGTIYAITSSPEGDTMTKVAPDGARTPVPLPVEPGIDRIVDVVSDQTGRVFVTLGSGYGSGAFRIVEPEAAGGPIVRYESSDQARYGALAVDCGRLTVVIGPNDGFPTLYDLGAGGSLTARADLANVNIEALAVDGDGTAFLLSSGPGESAIDAIATDGTISPLAYGGERQPRNLALGPDGTLFVADAARGLFAIDDVGAVRACVDQPASSAAPSPATPIPGQANYTG